MPAHRHGDKTGQEPDTTARYARLQARLQRLIPDAVVDHQWSGQVIDANDGLPFIGELGENQFAATGFAGNGMTFGTLGAMMATDWATRRKNPGTDIFDPGRKFCHMGDAAAGFALRVAASVSEWMLGLSFGF